MRQIMKLIQELRGVITRILRTGIIAG